MIEKPGTPEDKIEPDVRVAVALKLRTILQDWVGLDLAKSQAAAPIWNNLLDADTTDKDDGADEALRLAMEKMLADNIIEEPEMKGLIEEARDELKF